MSVSTQEDAKIVKPCDDTLKFYTIDQKNGQWDLIFPYKVQERVLQVLGAFSRHFLFPMLCRRERRQFSSTLKSN